MLRRLVVPLLVFVAALGALSAASDRQVHLPRAGVTDDAFVRADLTPLAAQVEARVVRVLVTDHQRVKQGQPLVQLDDEEFRARVEQAVARVSVVEAQLAMLSKRQALATAGIAAALATRDASLAAVHRTDVEAKRQEKLAVDGLTSAQEKDRTGFDAEGAHADLARREAELKRAELERSVLAAEAATLQAELAARQAEVHEAQIRLSYCTVTAPTDGQVGERQVRVGQLVRPGTQVITLVDIDHPWVTANVKERDLAPLTPGARVQVVVDAFADQPLVGTVESVAPASGAQFSLLPPDNASGNFTRVVQRVPVKVALTIPPSLEGRLVPGMSAVVGAP